MIPDSGRLAVFTIAALALLLVPGPAVLYVVARSIQHGRRAGLASVLGIHVGTLVHIGAATVGLSALIVSSAIAFTAVKVAGAVYLDRARALDALLEERGDGDRAGRRAEPAPCVRPGNRRQRAEPEDGALLPRVLAAVRRPRCRPSRAPDRVPRRPVRASRPDHRLSLGARGRDGGRPASPLARFLRTQRYVTGTVYIGLGVATALAGSAED